MQISERQTRRLAEVIVAAVLDQGFVRLTSPREDVTDRIFSMLMGNFRADEELEEEAERLARQHARQMAGMDQSKIIQGIKARLAKERGFPL